GAGVTIAIIDDGIDAAHKAVGGSVEWPNDKILGGYDFADNDADPRIDCPTQRHGTAVAGVAAGNGGGIIGSAPDAHLVFLKIQSANWCGQSGLDGDVVGAIDWVVSHRDEYNIGIISMSLGGGRFSDPAICDSYTAFRNAVSAAHDAGIAILAASGNNGYADAISFPACLSDVISVGAVYDSNIRSQGYIPACSLDVTAPDQVPCYSNSAEILDLLAPSDCATTAWAGGGTYGCFSGTSAATPFAAGVTATLLEAATQNLDSTAVRDLLTASGEPVLDGKNNLTTPRIDALAALTQLLPGWRIDSALHTYKSFESNELSGHFFRRQNALGHLSPILSTSDQQDATFKLVPGLAGRRPDSIIFPARFSGMSTAFCRLSSGIRTQGLRKAPRFACRTAWPMPLRSRLPRIPTSTTMCAIKMGVYACCQMTTATHSKQQPRSSSPMPSSTPEATALGQRLLRVTLMATMFRIWPSAFRTKMLAPFRMRELSMCCTALRTVCKPHPNPAYSPIRSGIRTVLTSLAAPKPETDLAGH
ncbi:MAG: S8 family serine peptidase, partial [Candidatus Tectomicrobia bacterium]|nr:S8 family serine peptidase [Candidatus Tectomicrobia bacterium]